MSLVLQSSGGGSVTLDEPVTASNFTISVPAVTGTMATIGPAFSANQGSAQGAISAATNVKVLFDTEEFDTNSNFASSRFTPTVAGYYQLNSSIRVDGSPTRVIVMIWKNGSQYKTGTDILGTVSEGVVNSLVYANGSTDYFEIYVYASGGTPTLTSTGTANIYFNGAMVRSA